MKPEAIRGEGETPVAVEDVVGRSGAKDRLDRTGAEPLDAVGDGADAPAPLELTGCPHDRAGEPDVGLDDRGHLVRRGAVVDPLDGLVPALQQ